MGIIKPPDYSFKNEVPLSSVMDLIANKNVRQSQLDTQDQNRRQQQFEDVRQVVGDASNTIQQMVQASVNRQHANAVKVLGGLLARQNEPVAAPGTEFGPQPAGTLPSGSQGPQPEGMLNQPPTTPLGQTPQYKTQLEAGLFNAFPQEAAKQQLEQIYTEKTANDQSKNWSPPKPYLVDNETQPRQLVFHPVTNQVKDVSTGEILNGHKLVSAVAPSAYADTRTQMLIAQLNDRFSKKMNPAQWSKGTPAGTSASLVANADSGLGLADQMLNGQIPITEQTMTSLAMDTNRVLTQTGVTSEKTTSELKAKTGQASFATGLQYFTSHPEDQGLRPFVEILKKELVRQRDQRQGIVDRTLASEFASLNQLRRLSPNDWENQIVANGFDLNAAKNGHLKIRPEVGSTLYGWDIGESGKSFSPAAPGGIQVDQNALDAELKKRGLQ